MCPGGVADLELRQTLDQLGDSDLQGSFADLKDSTTKVIAFFRSQSLAIAQQRSTVHIGRELQTCGGHCIENEVNDLKSYPR